MRPTTTQNAARLPARSWALATQKILLTCKINSHPATHSHRPSAAVSQSDPDNPFARRGKPFETTTTTTHRVLTPPIDATNAKDTIDQWRRRTLHRT